MINKNKYFGNFLVIPPYLMVNSLKDLRKIAGHMPTLELLNGTRLLKKRKIEDPSETQVQLLLCKYKKKYKI